MATWSFAIPFWFLATPRTHISAKKDTKKCILPNTLYPPHATEYTPWGLVTNYWASGSYRIPKPEKQKQWESVRGPARTSSPPSL